MDPTQNPRDSDRLTRGVLAAGLAMLALWSLRRGKRLRGLLAGLGAVALGYRVSMESEDWVEQPVEGLEADSTSGTGLPATDHGEQSTSETERSTATGQLQCAICGDPIVAGQPRTPNEDDEPVHEACLEVSA
jgi:hypothetical protein